MLVCTVLVLSEIGKNSMHNYHMHKYSMHNYSMYNTACTIQHVVYIGTAFYLERKHVGTIVMDLFFAFFFSKIGSAEIQFSEILSAKGKKKEYTQTLKSSVSEICFRVILFSYITQSSVSLDASVTVLIEYVEPDTGGAKPKQGTTDNTGQYM